MHKPSKADVLSVAGEPVAYATHGIKGSLMTIEDPLAWRKAWPDMAVISLYTESQLLAMYAAGIESAKSEGWRQCAVGQHTSQFCGMAEKARAEGANPDHVGSTDDGDWNRWRN